MSVNNVILMGRLGKDPELRKTQQGTSVASFSLAVDRNGKDAGTDWLDIVAWSGTAEFASKYLRAGRQVVVVGRLQTRKWEDKNGGKRTAVEVVADKIHFADSGKAAPSDRGAVEPAHFAEISEDGLPF